MRTQPPIPASTVAKLTGQANALKVYAQHPSVAKELEDIVARLEELATGHGCDSIEELEHRSRMQLEERRVNLEMEIRNANWAGVKTDDLEEELKMLESDLEILYN